MRHIIDIYLVYVFSEMAKKVKVSHMYIATNNIFLIAGSTNLNKWGAIGIFCLGPAEDFI